MKKTLLSILGAILALGLIACANDSSNDATGSGSGGNGGGGGSSSSATITKFNIANAKNIYIAKKGSATQSSRSLVVLQGGGSSENDTSSVITANEGDTLYIVNENDKVEEVKCTDENNKEVTPTETPVVIYTVNSSYIIVGYGKSSVKITKSYIVNKSTGAAYDLTKAGMPVSPTNDFKNAKLIKTVGTNAYYLTYKADGSSRQVVKIDLSGVDSLTSTVMSFEDDNVQNFEVDKDGNIAYRTAKNSYRFVKAAGGFGNFSSTPSRGVFWADADGYIRYIKDNSGTAQIIKITLSNGTISETETVVSEVDVSAPLLNFLSKGSSLKLDLPSGCIIVYLDEKDSAVYMLDTRSARKWKEAKLKSVTAVAVSPNYYYLAGNNSDGKSCLKRIHPGDTHYYEDFITPGTYDIYAFSASETDGITFNALRYTDGKKVLCSVATVGGDVNVINESNSIKVSCLERIN